MTTGRLPSVEGGIQPTIVDAKGDLIVATAADTVSRIAVGSNDQVLTADSSTSTGVKWATPAGSASITLLSTTTLSGTSTTISSISGSYTNLYLLIQDVYTSGTLFQFYINTDASMNYNTWGLADTSVDNRSGQGAGYARIGFLGNTSSGSSNTFSGAININNYASSTLNKSWNAFTSGKDSSNRRTGTVVSGSYYGGAITSVKFDLDGSSFSGGSVRIYGVN